MILLETMWNVQTSPHPLPEVAKHTFPSLLGCCQRRANGETGILPLTISYEAILTTVSVGAIWEARNPTPAQHE